MLWGRNAPETKELEQHSIDHTQESCNQFDSHDEFLGEGKYNIKNFLDLVVIHLSGNVKFMIFAFDKI